VFSLIVNRINPGPNTLTDDSSARAKPSSPLAAGDRLGRWAILDAFTIPAVMVGYAAVALCLCIGFGRPNLFTTEHYLLPFWSVYGTGICIMVVVYFALRGFRSLAGRPDDRRILGFEMPKSAAQLFQRIAIALPTLVALPLFMSGFTALKNLANVEVPFTWDVPLSALDRWIHLGSPPWQWADIRYWPLTRFIEYVYASWGVVLVVVPFIVAMAPIGPRRTRFFLAYVLIFVVLGNVLAALFMSAGPFYFTETGTVPNDYTDLMAYLDHGERERLYSATLFQSYLWLAYLKQKVEFGSGISAFPSVHVAMAMLWVIYFRRAALLLRMLFIAHLVVILYGSVHLAWHYAVDGYAAIIGALVIWWAIRQVQRISERNRQRRSGAT
jgi:hypothetical protein